MAEETEVIQAETEEVPIEETTMAEFKAARKDGKAAGDIVAREVRDAEEPVAAEKQNDGKPRSRGGFQARIDKITRENAEKEQAKIAAEMERDKEREEKEQLRREVEELRGKNRNGVPKAEQLADGEPKREDFDSDAAYNRALIRHETRVAIQERLELEEKQAIALQRKETGDRHDERFKELLPQHPNFQNGSIPPFLADTIVHQLENGPEVALYLGENPEVRKKLFEMTEDAAKGEIWHISKTLIEGENTVTETGEEIAAREEAEAAEAKAAEEAKQHRRAPAPIRPVSSGASRSTIDMDKTDMRTYKKLFAQGRRH